VVDLWRPEAERLPLHPKAKVAGAYVVLGHISGERPSSFTFTVTKERSLKRKKPEVLTNFQSKFMPGLLHNVSHYLDREREQPDYAQRHPELHI
jgi:hypothetical protein